jgi:cation:H+ antiporter
MVSTSCDIFCNVIDNYGDVGVSWRLARQLANEHDIAVGNIIGSNMFNLLAVLAMPGLIQPSYIDAALLQRDFPFMIGLFVMLYFFARTGHKGHIGRFAGVAMLFVYIAYNGLLAYQSMSGIPA